IERVFLEDVARRGLGRFTGLGEGRRLQALCHVGANVVPSGQGCSAFANAAARGRPRMVIGEERAVDDLWSAAAPSMPKAREDRPGQPVYVIREPPEPGGSGVREAKPADLDVLVPACARAHYEEIGIDPLQRDPDGFRWRTQAQIGEGRSWIWLEDAARRPAAAGLGRSGAAEPRLRAARHAGPLPAAARGRPGGLPVRAHGQRARDPRLRGDRDAACALLPEPDLLSIRRLLWLGAGLWVGRWAVLEAASWLERTRASGPPANASGRPPARMPGPDA